MREGAINASGFAVFFDRVIPAGVGALDCYVEVQRKDFYADMMRGLPWVGDY